MSNRFVGLIALVFLLAITLSAQNTGIISGRITDPTGAVVPGVKITVTQNETNVSSPSETNTEGLFRVPSLRPGTYKVTASAPGFKTAARDGVILRIGDNLNVEMTLEVGAITDSVEVSGALPLLETQTSTSGQVMSGDYFYELPNYQHWQKGVLYYTPQVQTSNAPWPGSLGNFNFNGGQSWQTAAYEDGILVTSMDGGTTINSVSVGIEEVKVISSAMPAEYGHMTSGALITVKKAGTNQFHGQGGYLFKSTSMMHRRFFQLETLQQQEKPGTKNKTLFQMPDGVVSGPLIIPKIYNGRNRTFFQAGFSWHIDSSSNSSTYTAPTDEMLNGDYSAYSNQLYDPGTTSGNWLAGTLSRQIFPGNIIPKSRFSTMWNKIAANNPFGVRPQPGIGTVTATGPSGNIVGSGTGNYYNYTEQFRVDHNFTDKLKMMLSYSMGDQHQPQNNFNITYKPYDQYQQLAYTKQKTAALNFTYTISPSLISETKIGVYRRTGNREPLGSEDYSFEIAKLIPNLPSNVYVNPISLGLSQGTNGGSQLGVSTLSVAVNNNHQLNQDFTWVRGTHAFKFGYEWLWMNYVGHNISNPRLTLNWFNLGYVGPKGESNSSTGNITFAAIQLGYLSSYSYAQQGTSLLPEDSNHSFYIQDDWRVTPKLTLNLGLRYSNETPAHSKFPGQLSVGSLDVPDNYYTAENFPNGVSSFLTCPAGGCKGAWVQPQGFLWNRDNNNFRPRFGFAWNVRPDIVVRGGAAMMTLDWNIGWTTQSEIGGGSFYNQNVSQVSTPELLAYYPLRHINDGVPAFVSPTPLANGTIPTTATSPSGRHTITVVPKDYHNPYTINWNFAVQKSIMKNYLVELSYVGMHNVGFQGTYNWQSRPYATGLDANGNVIDLSLPQYAVYRNSWISNSSGTTGTQGYKPYPNLGGVNYYTNGVSMIYHSGTAKVEKRYSYGLSFLAFLTIQKGIQNSPGNLYLDDSYNRSITSQTQKYRFVSSMNLELPFGKGKTWMNKGGLLDWVFGGYSFSWNFSVWAPQQVAVGYSNGKYKNPATGALGSRQDYPSYEPTYGSGLYRLNVIPELRDGWQDIGTNRWSQATTNQLVTNCGNSAIINPDGTTYGNLCVAVAPSFTNGNMVSRYWIPQRIIGANTSIYKDFPIKERFKAQLRCDYYNPFKWFNWNTLTTTMDQNNVSTFMKTAIGDFGDSTEGGPSQVHLSFRINF
jgi:hypothetical protein